jgi:hypothetical protein
MRCDLNAVAWARAKDNVMTHYSDRKKAARSLALALRCSYQYALDVLDGFPPDIRIEFPGGRATLLGRVVRCQLEPSMVMAALVSCELCPWQVGIDPFRFALDAALDHDATCPGTPAHLELIGPQVWRRIPDAELDRRAAAERTPRRKPVAAVEGGAVCLATRAASSQL